MALSPDFPTSPYAILDPKLRWYPGAEADQSEIGKLTNLTELYLNNNKLTSIPSEISKLTNLTQLCSVIFK